MNIHFCLSGRYLFLCQKILRYINHSSHLLHCEWIPSSTIIRSIRACSSQKNEVLKIQDNFLPSHWKFCFDFKFFNCQKWRKCKNKFNFFRVFKEFCRVLFISYIFKRLFIFSGSEFFLLNFLNWFQANESDFWQGSKMYSCNLFQ